MRILGHEYILRGLNTITFNFQAFYLLPFHFIAHINNLSLSQKKKKTKSNYDRSSQVRHPFWWFMMESMIVVNHPLFTWSSKFDQIPAQKRLDLILPWVLNVLGSQVLISSKWDFTSNYWTNYSSYLFWALFLMQQLFLIIFYLQLHGVHFEFESFIYQVVTSILNFPLSPKNTKLQNSQNFFLYSTE